MSLPYCVGAARACLPPVEGTKEPSHASLAAGVLPGEAPSLRPAGVQVTGLDTGQQGDPGSLL